MSKVTLVDFFAEGCGACRAQDPILEELERDIGHRVDIIRIGLADNKAMFDEFNINATPTLFIIKDNNILKKYIGVTSKNELEATINNAWQM